LRGNMQATQKYDNLRHAYAARLGSDIEPLEQAMNQLDFALAANHCNALLARYPSPSSS